MRRSADSGSFGGASTRNRQILRVLKLSQREWAAQVRAAHSPLPGQGSRFPEPPQTLPLPLAERNIRPDCVVAGHGGVSNGGSLTAGFTSQRAKGREAVGLAPFLLSRVDGVSVSDDLQLFISSCSVGRLIPSSRASAVTFHLFRRSASCTISRSAFSRASFSVWRGSPVEPLGQLRIAGVHALCPRR